MLFGAPEPELRGDAHIPVGVDNSFSPGPQDRGQPTHFYARRQSFVFRVTAPGRLGPKELVWTVNQATERR